MNGQYKIPVQVINHDTANESPSIQVMALLQQLQTMLLKLINHGEPDSIDVRSLPLSPADFRQLRSILGQGEVTASIDALGKTSIYETNFPGVWWVTHLNASDYPMAEFIEVTLLPEILQTHEVTLQSSLSALDKYIATNK